MEATPGSAEWDPDVMRDELVRALDENRRLRARDRSRPVVAMAQGILMERYEIPDADMAFVLLRGVSQRFNVKLRALVDVLLSTPRPDADDSLWFPGRVKRRPPVLTALRLNGAAPTHRNGMLRVVLSQVLAITGTEMGNVQLPDPVAQGLRLEHHTGLTEDFVDYFAFVGEQGTSCAEAAAQLSVRTVHDVATDPVFTDGARQAILEAGSRSCHSIPLLGADGSCVGMVSAHLAGPSADLTDSQSETLRKIGRQAGQWLSWHHDTVVLDALEYLHAVARRTDFTRLRPG